MYTFWLAPDWPLTPVVPKFEDDGCLVWTLFPLEV